MTTPALPPESAIAWKAAVFETSCGMVVTLAKMPASGSGPGLRAGVPADDRCAGLGGRVECDLLLVGVEAADDDAVGLEGQGLVHRGGAAGDRALAVDHHDLPADGGGGLLDALGRAENAAVLQVAGDEDDASCPCAALGPRRRAVPFVRAGGRGLRGLGRHVDVVVGARDRQSRQRADAREQGISVKLFMYLPPLDEVAAVSPGAPPDCAVVAGARAGSAPRLRCA